MVYSNDDDGVIPIILLWIIARSKCVKHKMLEKLKTFLSASVVNSAKTHSDSQWKGLFIHWNVNTVTVNMLAS